MRKTQTYTIVEASALTGLHRNTIRQRIRMGQLDASVQHGKFGEEYRISHTALVRAGLLDGAGPLSGTILVDEPRGAEHHADDEDDETIDAEHVVEADALAGSVQALTELYQRHEQAMFRLGYLQGELERVKALAETAESLREQSVAKDQEVQQLRTALDDKARQAAEAETLRLELDRAKGDLQEMERLRQDLEGLRALAIRQETVIEMLETAKRRPWWQFWK
jgi:hypothetical protein